MAARDCLTAERLRELLHYDSATGVFTWKVKRGNAKGVGSIAGGPDEHENPGGPHYWRIYVDRRPYRRGRLAWLYVNGCWPPSGEIDHVDGNRGNDALDNLRDATRVQNSRNIQLCKRSASGFKGVRKLADGLNPEKPWHARIAVDNVTKSLGCFRSAREAALAYDRAALLHHGEFARTNEMLGLI